MSTHRRYCPSTSTPMGKRTTLQQGDYMIICIDPLASNPPPPSSPPPLTPHTVDFTLPVTGIHIAWGEAFQFFLLSETFPNFLSSRMIDLKDNSLKATHAMCDEYDSTTTEIASSSLCCLTGTFSRSKRPWNHLMSLIAGHPEP